MLLTFEIVAIWTALNFVVGIPVWMLVKLRDRRDMFEREIEPEDSYAREPDSGFPNSAVAISDFAASRRLRPALPLVVGPASLVPGAGSAMQGAVHRVSTDHRSVTDI
jgi:hypothetical protein